jgi:glycosyltransferase involved in cell wall biosynthesis
LQSTNFLHTVKSPFAAMKILLSVFSCGATKTSEPGNAWRIVNHALDEGHDVWTITERDGYEESLRAYLADHLMPRLHPVFFSMPRLLKLRRSGMLGPIYYHLWQRELMPFARRLHEEIGFDLAHHVTFGRYWSPSGVRDLGIPFIWGPVGAAESTPPAFLAELGPRERLLEFIRDGVRNISHRDPALRDTARKATISLGVTRESCEAIRALGGQRVVQFPQGALAEEELDRFDRMPLPPEQPFRAICLGRLVHWKGFHLAIRAFAIFARSDPKAELWIVGGGPFRRELDKTVESTGMASRVRFWGQLSHDETMEKLAQCHVLVHPALHEAFGNVCLEAMASARPVVCLDLGGPATQVTSETGCVVPATTPAESVEKIAAFLATIAGDRALLAQLSEQARAHVRRVFSVRQTGARLREYYAQAMASGAASRSLTT